MKNIPQAYRPSYLWFWPPLILGGSVISAGTIHDLRRVKVPGTGPLWNPCQSNKEGERDSEENRDESDVNSDGEIDSESEFEQSEDETFRNINKFVEIEYEMEYH
jgi:hypothetical protein